MMQFESFEYSPPELFKYSLLAFIPLHVALCVFALAIDVAGKWMLLGRRKPGS